jgi:hypothetical protein
LVAEVGCGLLIRSLIKYPRNVAEVGKIAERAKKELSVSFRYSYSYNAARRCRFHDFQIEVPAYTRKRRRG